MKQTTSTENVHDLAQIAAWAKKHISNSALPDIAAECQKTLAKTTKVSIAQYLLLLVEHYEKQQQLLNSKEESIKSLNDSLKQQQKQIQTLNAELEHKDQAISDTSDHLENERKQVMELNKKLKNVQDKAHQLQQDMLQKNTLLEKMSLKSMESILSIIPDWVASGANWKNEYAKLQSESAKLTSKFNSIQNKLNEAITKHQQEKHSHSEDKTQLEKKIRDLTDENELLAAKNNAKVGERLADYEKRENYQIVKEYREFCLHQGLDYLAEEIVNFKQSAAESELEDNYKMLIAATKYMLATHLLVTPYQIQVHKLRRNSQTIDFESFKRSNLTPLAAELELSAHINEQLLKIAHKAFSLINELITVTPPCQLLLAENGSAFDPVEHDVDELYCKPSGMVKFIIAPGVYSGHEILMKPVVFTEQP